MATLPKGPSCNERLGELPPYLFVALDRKKREAQARGVDILNLGIGDPDLPTPEPTVRKAQEAMTRAHHHRYPLGKGDPSFRQAAARWYAERFSVRLDPETEVLALIGSKEGIGHLPLALVSPGETVLVPDPGYPPYLSGTVLAGGKPHRVVLKEEDGFLPDLASIPKAALRKAKLLFLNYPNNPTGATADLRFFREAVAFARRNDLWIAHDAAYSELFFKTPPPSLLQVEGAKEVALEFHSLSKTYNMTGWRVGWACGNPRALAALAQVKDNFDSGVFGAVQEAAAFTLQNGSGHAKAMRRTYGERRSVFVEGLKGLGWKVFDAGATFYVWCRPPKPASARRAERSEPEHVRPAERGSSQRACERVLEEAGIVATPGSGFGPAGEGYVRFALTVGTDLLKGALGRLEHIRW